MVKTGSLYQALVDEWRSWRDEEVTGWADRASFLRHIAYHSTFDLPLDDTDQIESFLSNQWNISVVTIPGDAWSHSSIEIHATTARARELGRISLRRLSLFHTGNVYIAFSNRENRNDRLWILLHELGHLAHHGEVFMACVDSYRKICAAPGLEEALCSILAMKMDSISMERDADIFAANWLRRHLDESWVGALESDSPSAVWGLISRAFDGSYPLIDPLDGVASLHERSSRLLGLVPREYPIDGLPVVRAMWALLRVLECKNEDSRFVDKVYDLAPSSVKGLLHLHPGDVVEWIRGDNWEPALVMHREVPPDYFVPISPVPHSSDIVAETDLGLTWRNMYKRIGIRSNRTLDEWLAIHAEYPGRGLMLFPRTPAERAIDSKDALRLL